MLRTTYQKVDTLAVHDILRMHAIFEAHYANAPMAVFMRDLSRKDGVFVVRKKSTQEIVGFSTLGIYDFQLAGRRVRGLFSGDTIIERAYWGTRSLQGAFALKLFTEALKRPFSKQYWLLISKGYKTYLLLARNFPEYYPRLGGRDEHLKPLVEEYCEALFPGKLDRGTMLLDFGEGANCLKHDVAQIDEALKARDPHVRLFEQLNPTWQRGTELPCIARTDLWAFVKAVGPFLVKAWRGAPSGSRAEAEDLAAQTQGR